MTEQNKTPLTAQPGSAPAPERKPAEKPLRRVGSLTLGACLIAAACSSCCISSCRALMCS